MARRLSGLLVIGLFPALTLVLGVRMLPFLMMPVLILVPGLLSARSGPSTPPDDSGESGGGGPRGPGPPEVDPDAIRIRDLRRPRVPG